MQTLGCAQPGLVRSSLLYPVALPHTPACSLKVRSGISRRSRVLQAQPLHGRRMVGMTTRCSAEDQLHVTEPNTGVDFSTVQRFWVGDAFRCLGAAVRTKKFAFLNVKVYATALYVEAEKAAKELGVRSRGGFFSNDDDFCLAIMDGAFHKALQIRMARKVEGAQFVEAFEEALTPRLTLMGELKSLADFKGFFQSRPLEKDTDVLLLWRQEGALEVAVRPPGDGPPDYQKATADLRIESAGMCRALFEVYLGSSPVIPEAKTTWARGAKALLETEEVRRSTRKSGGS